MKKESIILIALILLLIGYVLKLKSDNQKNVSKINRLNLDKIELSSKNNKLETELKQLNSKIINNSSQKRKNWNKKVKTNPVKQRSKNGINTNIKADKKTKYSNQKFERKDSYNERLERIMQEDGGLGL